MTHKAILLKTDGTSRYVDLKPDIELVNKLLGSQIFQMVRTLKGVLLVDDSGLIDGREINPIATQMYPGDICGDALLFESRESFDAWDEEFADE